VPQLKLFSKLKASIRSSMFCVPVSEISRRNATLMPF
jgi:hypothetical protein